MQIEKGFQCHSCHIALSYPLDACPLCGDQFYWMVLVSGTVPEQARKQYVVAMCALSEDVTEEFLTYDDQLWLPYQFWEYCPTGEVLRAFTWIVDLQLFQHQGKPGSSEPAQQAEQASTQAKQGSVLDSVPETRSQLDRMGQANEEPSPQLAAQMPASRRKKPNKRPKQMGRRDIQHGIKHADLLKPTLVFLFFVLLSLSYLVLRYHKNHMVPIPQAPVEEVSNERPILS